MVGVCVSLCGVIGFVGLMVPHAVRLILGPNVRQVFLGSLLLGPVLLLLADLLVRTGPFGAELPIGVLTAFLGGAFFLLLLFRRAHMPSAC